MKSLGVSHVPSGTQSKDTSDTAMANSIMARSKHLRLFPHAPNSPLKVNSSWRQAKKSTKEESMCQAPRVTWDTGTWTLRLFSFRGFIVTFLIIILCKAGEPQRSWGGQNESFGSLCLPSTTCLPECRLSCQDHMSILPSETFCCPWTSHFFSSLVLRTEPMASRILGRRCATALDSQA